jgi:hypothetical protein
MGITKIISVGVKYNTSPLGKLLSEIQNQRISLVPGHESKKASELLTAEAKIKSVESETLKKLAAKGYDIYKFYYPEAV